MITVLTDRVEETGEKGTGPFMDGDPANPTTTNPTPPPSMKGPVPSRTALFIRDWDTRHENGHMRRRKSALPAVLLPTGHDGSRYRRIARMPRGLEIYAVWCLLISIAGRCVKRGLLIDDFGEPLTYDDMEGMTGFPAAAFEFAIAALLDEKIGWLQIVPLNQAEPESLEVESASGAKADDAPGPSSEPPGPPPLAIPTAPVGPRKSTNQNMRDMGYAMPSNDKQFFDLDDPEDRATMIKFKEEDAAKIKARGFKFKPVSLEEYHRRMTLDDALIMMGLDREVDRKVLENRELSAIVIMDTWNQIRADPKMSRDPMDQIAEFNTRLRQFRK